MSTIYETLVGAIREHWKAHANQYPQKIVLSAAQHQTLLTQRKLGRVALGTDDDPETDSFLGVPLEVDDSSPLTLVAVDGSAHQPGTAPAET